MNIPPAIYAPTTNKKKQKPKRNNYSFTNAFNTIIIMVYGVCVTIGVE